LVGRRRTVVGGRSARLLDHGVNRLFINLFQTVNFIVDDALLNRAATG
jgi:hypothetical protein